VGHVACIWAMRYDYKIFVGKPELKTQLRIRRCRWEDIFFGENNIHLFFLQ
jgi:hypothetical protein